jgi:DNA polymerase I-like protein with 3'-5' exonuclease and polymerase domains
MVGRPYEEVYAAYKAGEKWAVAARQAAKSETFKPLYGGSKGTPAQERWYTAFKQRYPDLARTQEDWVYEVLATKRLITPWGLRYYFPHAKVSDSGFVNVGSTVYNYPIQALATAEIVPIAVSYFWHTVKARGLGDFIVPVNTIHDSLVCEIHQDYQDEFRDIAQSSFGPSVYRYLRDVYKMDYSVPLGIGIKIAEHWGEGEEELYEYFDGTTERRK